MGENSPINIDTQPVADVVNNLIDKIADVVGWIAKPSDKKLCERRAEQYLIEKIETREEISPIDKAAYMSKARKIIKEYTNQKDIVQMAIDQLSDTANPKGIEDDWLLLFFDFCKNVSNEDIKCIWAKVLAEECNNNGFITKRLLSILQVIGKQEAAAFHNILKFIAKDNSMGYGSSKILLIYGMHLDNIYRENGVREEDLRVLNTIGLIQIDKLQGFFIEPVFGVNKVEILFSNREITVEFEKKVPIGVVHLTPEGEILAEILSVNEAIGFPEYVYDILSKHIKNVKLH